MSRLIFGLASRLPTSTALLSLGQIRLPLQEQINSIAKRCGVLGLTEHQLSHGQKQRPCRTTRRSANLYVSNCGHSRGRKANLYVSNCGHSRGRNATGRKAS